MPHDTPTLNEKLTVNGVDLATVKIDVDKLVETRLLVQANSGGGKSRTLRRLFEQTYDHVQHIIIDWDGEFHTLREKYDYVLAAPHGGDCVANLASAGLLARRLLELGVSTIVDISDLGPARIKFVQLFLESLMLAPRDLWHRVLIGIDEAHRFAPEEPANKDEVECCAAVVSLMADGRKRGFCGVLATQRISKLDKNAAAECNNLLIGRASLDLDIRRAAGIIGMSIKDARAALPHLRAGEFFVVGPALTPIVECIRMGPVTTTHPTAGSGGGPPTPPRAQVRAILAKLGDLPAEAAEEAKTTDQLRAKIRQLEAMAKTWEDNAKTALAWSSSDYTALDERAAALEKRVLATEIEREEARAMEHAQGDLLDELTNHLDSLIGQLGDLRNLIPDRIEQAALAEIERTVISDAMKVVAKTITERDLKVIEQTDRAVAEIVASDGLTTMQRAFLTVLAQRGPQTKKRILIYSGYKRSGSTDKAFAALARDVLIDGAGQFVEITPTGREVLGEVPPVVLKREMPEMQRAFLTVLAQRKARTVGMPKSKVMIFAGYARSGSTDKAWAALAHNEWIIADGNGVTITGDGLDALGPFELLPTGPALRERIKSRLRVRPGEMAARLFETFCKKWPGSITRAHALEIAGYKRSGSTDKAFAHLTAREWVIPIGNGQLAAAKELFE
jgi:hypothetical protein